MADSRKCVPPAAALGSWKVPGLALYNKRGLRYSMQGFPPEVLDNLPEVRLSKEDVVVASYPKSGTTWTQEMVYLIQNGVDVEEARTRSLSERFLFMDLQKPGAARPEMDKIPDMTSPRLLKTHMPYEMMEQQVERDGARFVVPMRNPKDTYVSYYHFYKVNRSLGMYPGTWDEFYRDVISTDELWGGNPVDYSLGWWRHRHRENVHVVFYEAMKADLPAVITETAAFLGRTLTAEQVERCAQALSFKTMKSHAATNSTDVPYLDKSKGAFMRKGEVGDWRNYFSEEQSAEVDEDVQKRLAGTGLSFRYSV